jgi:hypothetical protein
MIERWNFDFWSQMEKIKGCSLDWEFTYVFISLYGPNWL